MMFFLISLIAFSKANPIAEPDCEDFSPLSSSILGYQRSMITKYFTSDDSEQDLLKQISSYLIKTYPIDITRQHILNLKSIDGTDGEDLILIAPGRYEFQMAELFSSQCFPDSHEDLIKVEVTESEPVGQESGVGIYRTLSLTGLESNLDSVIYEARKLVDIDDANYIKIYQTNFWGTWNSGSPLRQNMLKKRPLNTIFLDKDLIENILRDITKFFDREELYAKHGISYHRNYLLTGPPGTGKTSLIHALASELNMGLSIINFHHYFDKGSLVKCLSNLPRNTIIVVEDIDALYDGLRESNPERNGLTFSDFINAIDGFTAPSNGVLLFMTTNYPERIDPALLRPGRVDFRLDLLSATEYQIKSIFLAYYPNDTPIEFYERYKMANFEHKLSTASLQNFFFRHLDIPLDQLLDIMVDSLSQYLPPNPVTPIVISVNTQETTDK